MLRLIIRHGRSFLHELIFKQVYILYCSQVQNIKASLRKQKKRKKKHNTVEIKPVNKDSINSTYKIA